MHLYIDEIKTPFPSYQVIFLGAHGTFMIFDVAPDNR